VIHGRTPGEYEVTGRRNYRGHQPGSVFTAVLNTNAAGRAIMRGDIRLVREILPSIEPGTYQLPPGWAEGQQATTTEGAPHG